MTNETTTACVLQLGETITALIEALEAMRDLAKMAEYQICSGNRGCLGEQALYHRTMNQAHKAIRLAKAGER